MLSNEEFSELVAADARWQEPTPENPHPHNRIKQTQRDWLRNSDNLNDWMDELKATMRKIDSQVTSHKAEAFRQRIEYLRRGNEYTHECSENIGRDAWLDFTANDITWKATALRFKRSVEDRLREAKKLHHEYNPSLPVAEQQVEVVRLRSAIAHHRDSSDFEPSTEDEKLWKTIS